MLKEVIQECLEMVEIEGWTARSIINNPSWVAIENRGEDKRKHPQCWWV